MAGDFFAEPFNVFLFVGVLGALTFMITGCYVYHKLQRIKSKNAPDIVPQKPKRKLKRFLQRNSCASEHQRNADLKQMELDASNNYSTSQRTSAEGSLNLGFQYNLDDDVFRDIERTSFDQTDLIGNGNCSSISVNSAIPISKMSTDSTHSNYFAHL